MSEPIDPSSNPSVDASGASRLTDVSDLIEESVVIFGLDFRVTAWNAEAERIYGWKRGEVLGRRIQSIVSCLPSEPLHSIMAKVPRDRFVAGRIFPDDKVRRRRGRSGEMVDAAGCRRAAS